ncbi:MAG TPA: tripartite tricarboxylate transporter substrate binding protein [Zeimonas sp.]|nr:tripartite tricarboxylate transporter substrate binding protein [Zeimonas sp.]
MKRIGIALATAATLAFSAASAVAQSFPDQPVRIVVPYSPGGSGDTLTRTLAEQVSKRFGQSVVVENKPGGGTVIGAQAVANAPADGLSLLFVAASFVINEHLMPKLPFKPLADFAPVTLAASNPHVLVVHPSVPANDLQEFIAWAKARNGQATFASFGNGSSGHLGFELLKKAAGFDMVHVPYKGVAPATTDLIGGQVDAMLSDLPQVIQYVTSGKLKAIAIAAAERAPTLPEVPTMDESGLKDFRSGSWYGFVVRAGTPEQAIARWSEALVAALHEPSVQARLEQLGMDTIASTREAFGRFLASESQRYAEAVRLSGARVD